MREFTRESYTNPGVQSRRAIPVYRGPPAEVIPIPNWYPPESDPMTPNEEPQILRDQIQDLRMAVRLVYSDNHDMELVFVAEAVVDDTLNRVQHIKRQQRS